MSVRATLLVGVVVLLGSCTDPVCACPPVDTSGHVVVRGTVLDANAAPVEGVEVHPIGPLVFDCRTPLARPISSIPPVTVSDWSGRFELTLVSNDNGGTGAHCFQLLATDPARAASDTLDVRDAPFRSMFVPPDTVFVALLLGG